MPTVQFQGHFSIFGCLLQWSLTFRYQNLYHSEFNQRKRTSGKLVLRCLLGRIGSYNYEAGWAELRTGRKNQLLVLLSLWAQIPALPLSRLNCWVSQVTLVGKNPQETQVRSLAQEDPLEKGMETHFSILAWRIPRREKLGGLQSLGSWRVRHDWCDLAHTAQTYSWTAPVSSPECGSLLEKVSLFLVSK